MATVFMLATVRFKIKNGSDLDLLTSEYEKPKVSLGV
jgi:hypothetical protein